MRFILTNVEKIKLQQCLNVLTTRVPITWDRFTVSEHHDVHIYGWIPNPDPRYQDFISLFFDGEWEFEGCIWSTSSKQYSSIIGELIGGNEDPCQKWKPPKTNQGGNV